MWNAWEYWTQSKCSIHELLFMLWNKVVEVGLVDRDKQG